MRKTILSAACALLLFALAASSADAHAYLESATPGSGAVVRASPRAIRLLFDVDVVPRYARVEVVTPRGREIAGTPRVVGGVVTVPLRPGASGSYTVRWRMVASADGHATEGAYTYGVRVKPLPPAPARGIGVPVAPQLLAWVQFFAIVLAGGLLTVRALVAVPAARVVRDRDVSDSAMAIRAGAIGAVLGLHAGVLAFLVGAYPIVGGPLGDFVNTAIEPIRVGTHLGQAWTLTTFAWFGVLVLIVAAWVTPDKRERLLGVAGLLTLAIAFGMSWASHPASRGGIALLADYLHLLAAALWVGGLVAIWVLARNVRALPRQRREEVVRACVLRFSALALPIVVVVAIAGAYLALRELPGPGALIDTGYGLTLLAKSLVVLAALALGIYHRRVVVPRLGAGVELAAMRRTLAVELGCLLTVLALAAMLAQTAPPS
jgi:copper transport protein